MDDNKQNDYASRLKEFKAKFPNYKEAEPVECLNLIMRKEFAKQILEGKKKLEFRGYTDHYISRLYDNDVLKFMQLYKNEPEVLAMCEPLRMVEKIHFHNYNDTWHLDVECTMNEVVGVTDADVSSCTVNMIAMNLMRYSSNRTPSKASNVRCTSILSLARLSTPT